MANACNNVCVWNRMCLEMQVNPGKSPRQSAVWGSCLAGSLSEGNVHDMLPSFKSYAQGSVSDAFHNGMMLDGASETARDCRQPIPSARCRDE